MAGRVGVMVTDGGPHGADKWAAETAAEIMSYVKVADNVDTPEARAVRRARPRMELDIADVLEEFHGANIEHERAQIEDHGDERLSHFCDPHCDHVSEAVEAVVAAAVSYDEPFASAFNSDNGRAIIEKAVKVHMATAMHIERGWHADRMVAAGEASLHVKNFKKGS